MQISELGKIFIFFIVGTLFVMVGYFINFLLRKDRPNEEKLSSYECGEEAVGDARVSFNIRFYVLALVFLLFEVELVFIFPWTTVFAKKELLATSPNWGWFTLAEMFIFIGILLIGFIYVWKKKDLEWIRPNAILPKTNTMIPKNVYERINQEKYTVKAFTLESVAETDTAMIEKSTNPVKPTFRPGILKK